MLHSACWRTAAVVLALVGGAGLRLSAAGAQVPDSALPVIDAPVTDLAGVLSEPSLRSLSAELVRHREATGVQLAVLLLDTTAGEPIEDYALRVATLWRGGSAARSEGALYVLAVSDRRQRLEVGYGLEDRIPDYTAARILEEAIPHLRRQSYQGAVEAVVRATVSYTSDMAPVLEEPLPERSTLQSGFVAALVSGILLLGTFIGSRQRRKHAAARTQELALGVTSSAERQAMLGMGLYLVVSGTAAGQLGFGWFHYLGAFVGLLAGWRFAWDSIFLSLHYLFMVSILGAVFTGVVAGLSQSLGIGIGAGFVAQLFVTFLYSGARPGSHTSFSSGGVKDDGQEFHDLLRTTYARSDPSDSSWHFLTSSRSAKSGSSGSSSSSSGGGFGSSSRSSGSSSSSSRSSSSSSRSSGYSGGGGRFGGGGASSSW